MKNKKILVLTSNPESIKKIEFVSLIKRNFRTKSEIELGNIRDVWVYILDNLTITIKEKNICDYDLVIFRGINSSDFLKASLIALGLKGMNVLFIDEVYSTIGATKGKIISLLQLYLNGLPIPKTVFYTGAINENTYENVSKVLGSEFLVKRLSIQRGEGVYKIKLEKDIETLPKWSENGSINEYLFQEFIFSVQAQECMKLQTI